MAIKTVVSDTPDVEELILKTVNSEKADSEATIAAAVGEAAMKFEDEDKDRAGVCPI